MSLTQDECLDYLEKILWDGVPKCPYCQSTNATPYKAERRYHCNSCFTSFSVTVGTLFHKSHVDLQKWFLAISIFLKSDKKISVRHLAEEIGVNKNTASLMLNRIHQAVSERPEILHEIVKINGD
jgi:transposase-like protein